MTAHARLSRGLARPLVDSGPDPFVWLDASEDGDFTYSSGTLVSAWADRSGTGHHMVQGTGGKRPDRTGATQNGLEYLSFAAGQKMRCAIPQVITAAFTGFAVFRKTGAQQSYEAGPYTQTSAGGWGARPMDSWDGSRFINQDGGTQWGGFNYNKTQTTWCLLSQTLNGSTYTEWKNGTLVQTITHGQPMVVTGEFVIASRGDEFTQLVGDIAEIRLYDELGTDDRQDVEAELMAKWGL